jgi:competence protein ComEC
MRLTSLTRIAPAQRGVNFSARPLAHLAASFACGVLLAHLLNVPLAALVAAFALASALAVAAFARRSNAAATALVCASFLIAGAAHAAAERRGVAPDRVARLVGEGKIEPGEPVELTGTITRAPEAAADGFFVELRVEKIDVKGAEAGASGAVELFAPVRDLSAYARYDALELRRGARVRVMTSLSRAEEFRNPGAGARTEFLEREGFDAAGSIKSPLLVERLDDERVPLPLAWLDGWRARLHAEIGGTFSAETAGVLQAAMLGNRHGLSRGVAERFRDGGTFHVLVVSGLHVGFLGGLALWLARRLTRRRVLQVAASASLVWAYAVAVGAHPSVLRAALMFTFLALAPAAGRGADGVNALGAAALALLAWRPEDLFDPSFQLTFLSVAGIALVGWPLLARLREVGAWSPTSATPHPPRCPRWFRRLGEALFWSERAWRRERARNAYDCRLFKSPTAARLERLRVQRALRYAFAAVVVSASVQVVMLPLLVIYFHRIALAAVALNIYTGALMAFAALASLAAVALAHAGRAAAAPLVWSVERAVWLMAHGVDPFRRAGLGTLRLPHYAGRGALVYSLYYLPPAALALALARWRPLELGGATRDVDADGGALDPAPGDGRARPARRGLGVRRGWRGARRFAPAASSVSFAALALVVVSHPLSAPPADGRLRIDFLDVGQGDAALVTLPDGTTLLVDGGGRPPPGDEGRGYEPAAGENVRRPAAVGVAGARGGRPEESDADEADGPARFERDARGVGDAVVSEFLWWRGLSRVDYLLATHAHADHMEGLRDVARNFAPRAALDGRAPRRDEEYARFAAAMRDAGVPVRLVARGDELRFGSVSVDVLYPPPAPHADASRAGGGDAGSEGDADTGALPSGNDDSVVLRLRYGSRCFLLTGDVERGAEGALVAARDDLRCDVVKVGHHGSRTSSTAPFVAAARPAFAVVSVGLDSPFGHPDPSVVARWRAAGAQVLQTGRRGTITVSTDGGDLRVETFARDD